MGIFQKPYKNSLPIKIEIENKIPLEGGESLMPFNFVNSTFHLTLIRFLLNPFPLQIIFDLPQAKFQ